MARTKGTANLAASLEVLAGAPLDSRTVVPTVADLTVAANFPYKYVGMPVVVQATGDMYILTENDVTVPANWKKQSGSGGSGGHTIEDNGIAMTARAGLNFTDFDISDDSTNDETDVKAHRLTSEEMEDIIYKVPSLANLSQLGTEAMIFSTSEKAVGQWTDGKIVYAKTVTGTSASSSSSSATLATIQNVDTFIYAYGDCVCNSNDKRSTPNVSSSFEFVGNDLRFYTNSDSMFGKTINAVMFYTKTTDTALASGEKYAGLTANGEVIYEQDVTVNNFSCSQGAETQIANLSSTSIDKMIYCFGTISESSWGTASIPELGIRLRYKDGKLYLKSDGSWSSSTVSVKIRYTKTS